MGKGIYNLLWESHYSWITFVKGDKHKAFCMLCLKTFQIDGSGISQVTFHEKSNIHEKSCPRDQRTLICNNGLAQLNPSNSRVTFLPEEQVIRAEIYHCLQVVSSNYSFTLFFCYKMLYNKVQFILILNFTFMSYKMSLILFQKVLE